MRLGDGGTQSACLHLRSRGPSPGKPAGAFAPRAGPRERTTSEQRERRLTEQLASAAAPRSRARPCLPLKGSQPPLGALPSKSSPARTQSRLPRRK